MDCKLQELDAYKTCYTNLSTDIDETKKRVEDYMKNQANGLMEYMTVGNKKMQKMEDRIN